MNFVVAQVSKPAVSPISKSAARETFEAHREFSSRAGSETCDTADLEICATMVAGSATYAGKLDSSWMRAC